MAYVSATGVRMNYFVQSEDDWKEEIENTCAMVRYEVMILRDELFRKQREYREHGVIDKEHMHHDQYMQSIKLMKAAMIRMRELDDAFFDASKDKESEEELPYDREY